MPTPFLDPQLLPTFVAVAEQGRISAAARSLNLSQPAVTGRVRRLEASLGVPLLVRSVRGVTLTAAGRKLLDAARQVQALLERTAAELATGRSDRWGAVHLAASTTIAAHALPTVLVRFRERYPEATLKVEVGNTEEVLELVRSGRVPLGLVEGASRAAGLSLEPWLDDPLVPVVAPAARWRIRSLADLAEVPLLWREPGSGTRAVVSRALRRAGLRRRPQGADLVLASSEAIAGAAVAGLGLAFLSRWSVHALLDAGRLHVVPGLDLDVRRTFRWALPAGALAPAAAEFLRFARENRPSPS